MRIVKRLRNVMCSFLALTLLFSATSFASESEIKVFINGEHFVAKDSNGSELKALVRNGTTYLPLRAISEALDIPVKWDNSIRSVILGTKPPSKAVKSSEMAIYLNGKAFSAKDAGGKMLKPLSINGITYLPLRSISEALNIPVRWDGANRIVALGTEKKIEKISFDGNYYEGEVKNGEPCGYGSFSYDDGTLIYVGEWLDGRAHGIGTMFYENGLVVYTGDWVSWVPHGKGAIYSEEGNLIYKGEISLGEFHGMGTDYYESGNERYLGAFKNDNRDGRGILYYEDGTTWYVGDWKNGAVHGTGTEYYEDGSLMYKGDYLAGKKHGLGILYNEDGTVQHKGKFENDLPVK